jgi:hypothetical protein
MPQTLYRVTINGSAAPTTAPNEGFIDNLKIQDYMAQGATAPTTLDQTTAKERANWRFKFLQQQLQYDANVYISETVSTGGSATAQPTSFVFTAVVERGDDVLFTRDENGDQDLTGTDALIRWVARALVESRTSVLCDIWDPTKAVTAGNTQPQARFGERIMSIGVGPVANNLTAATALVSVTKLY